MNACPSSTDPEEAARLVSDKRGAELTGTSVSGFQRLGLPKVRFSRRCVRYRLSDIVALINKRTINSKGGAR